MTAGAGDGADGPGGARWLRRARVAGAVAVVAALAVAVPLAPRWVEASRPEAPLAAPGTVEVSTECRTRADGGLDHPDFLLGDASWARFCVVGGSYPRPIGSALVPDTVLSDGAAALVGGWQRSEGPVGPCRPTPSATKFAVQVGFDDGTVAEVYGETSECAAYTRPGPGTRVVPGGRVFRELMTALALEESGGSGGAGGSVAPAPSPTCPAAPPALPSAITRRPATGLAATGVAEAVVCRYDRPGADPVGTPLRPTEAERVRLLALGAFDPTPPACTPDPGAASYVVLLAGHDGATYDLGLAGGDCDAVRLDDQRLGTSPALATALAGLAAGTGS
ncbi:hypothetical protein [Nocardioides marmotae]|uniref:Uncharacterized protein n=1 Tax=Nocardioides marmotae TaxID=2663857 RepID=A0A6I3JFF9_9ACTN|nr:hypothetical protein [Nocardioides marmotae]MCR6033046.1 hypothetical protein [Gordonia jinghuaiqii]MBC9732545.1 hypothetical protein [Nocardioides marmotae]MTB83664.1 hypothetical protein [Nocardioides marmotae]MTB96698.1 hypothetical protein [Nocardioides marmotae]QKE03088.1 hypothetical protein HPC71_20010 [Nocardioides marmotae]